jgi:hypothetical protein
MAVRHSLLVVSMIGSLLVECHVRLAAARHVYADDTPFAGFLAWPQQFPVRGFKLILAPAATQASIRSFPGNTIIESK